MKLLLVMLTVLWLGYPILRTVKNVMFWHEVNMKKIEMITTFREAQEGAEQNCEIGEGVLFITLPATIN